MPGSRPTIADLLRRQQRWARERGRWWAPFRLRAADDETDEGEAARAGLAEVADFGPDPGALRMLARVPEGLPPGAPLVVVLHGCTQSAAAFDRACGWSDLAARLGFALLLPEQRRANNPKRCFNWFSTGDTRRGAGEALSIRSMVARMLAEHGLDSGRVYVAGLSAGGAMTAAMLAAYPEVFAGGAFIGGLPYGAATDARQARPAMKGRLDRRPAGGWGEAVRATSAHRGPWPRVSVWQGGADRSVHPVNAERLVEQWTGCTASPARPRWRSGTAATCAGCGSAGMGRRWSRRTPSPAWGTARRSARARAPAAAGSPGRRPWTWASPRPTASSRSGGWRRRRTRPSARPLTPCRHRCELSWFASPTPWLG